MVRLKNWAFARDMFCSDPDLMREVLRNILKRDMDFSDITTEDIKDVIVSVGCTMTQDGFEASMTIWCSRLSRRLVYVLAPWNSGTPENEQLIRKFTTGVFNRHRAFSATGRDSIFASSDEPRQGSGTRPTFPCGTTRN